MSNVWRVGSNWDGERLREVFRKYSIAFAGTRNQDRFERVEINDLVAVGDGAPVIGAGRVAGKCLLSEVLPPEENHYGEDLIALKLAPLFWSESTGIYYDGQLQQFFNCGPHYAALIEAFFRSQLREFLQNEMKAKLGDLLRHHWQLILTGAPGTGKSHLARAVAADLIGVPLAGLSRHPQFRFVQFHPSWDYSDFVQGLKPVRNADGVIAFDLQDGVFKKFCHEAELAAKEDEAATKPRKFIFLIDEINRADLSRVFGELFFAIEAGYRGEPVETQYFALDPAQGRFHVPRNVLILGTMNDIDRSVESLDFALRRRFAWQEIPADNECFDRVMADLLAPEEAALLEEARRRYTALNEKILATESLGEAYRIGPAYFRKLASYLGNRDTLWHDLWRNHLAQLLREYLRGVPDGMALMAELRRAYGLPE